MPSSAIESLPYIIEFIRKNNPKLKSVLDVGVGFGKNGYLLREYFDAREHKKFKPRDWKLKITGVEIFPGYLSELQKKVYTKIVIGDIFKVLPKLGRFDIALLTDIIEHFPKDKGLELLDKLFQHTKSIVIATPLGFQRQKAAYNNPHEEHKSGWTLNDFKKFQVTDKAVIKRIRKPEKALVVYLRK